MSIKKGFGIIEIIVALGLFAVVGVTGITLVLHSFTTNRLGDEQTTASNLSSAGIDIVRNLRKQNWSNLTAGTYGLKNTAGLWSFTSTPENWGKFSRSITIADTADSDIKSVTATTTWNVGGSRNNSVIFTTYLANFAKSVTSVGDAFIAWGDTTTTPKWNFYTNATDIFGTKANLVTGASARNIVVKTSPTKREAIVGYVSSVGTLRVLCFDGSSWSEDWSTTVGGTGTTRRFDLGYEESTGDAMVVYSTNTATSNELAYRTKAGSSGCGSGNWSGATNLTSTQTNGIVQWVTLAEDERSGQNILGLLWADSASDLSAMLWNGTAWVNEPTAVTEANLEVVTTSQDSESFDLTFESLTGNLMLVWGTTVGNNANGVRYRLCTGGTATCTWGSVTTPPTFNDDATNLDIASNPGSNEIVFASIGVNQNDLQVGYWSGTTWTGTANVDTSSNTPIAGSKKVATGWLKSGATTRSIITYDDQGSGRINWVVGSSGTFVTQGDFTPTPTFANSQGTHRITMDPNNNDRLLYTVADNSNDLFTKRLVMTSAPAFTWTDSDLGPLELNLSQNIASPFSLSYWRNP